MLLSDPQSIMLNYNEIYSTLKAATAEDTVDQPFPETGNFSIKLRKGRPYFYFQNSEYGRRVCRYVGPADDPDLVKIADEFSERKASFSLRKVMVNKLKSLGAMGFKKSTSSLILALYNSGFFTKDNCLLSDLALICHADERISALDAANIECSDLALFCSDELGIEYEDAVPLPSAIQSVISKFEGFSIVYFESFHQEYSDKVLGIISEWIPSCLVKSIALIEAGISVKILSIEVLLIYYIMMLGCTVKGTDGSTLAKVTLATSIMDNGQLSSAASILSRIWATHPESRDTFEDGLQKLSQETRDKLLPNTKPRHFQSSHKRVIISASKTKFSSREALYIPDVDNNGFSGELHKGDCIDIMETIKRGTIDLVFTSPPYNLNAQSWVMESDKSTSKWRACSLHNGYDNYADALPHEEYVRWQKRFLSVCWDIISECGAIFYNHKPLRKNGKTVLPLEYNPGLPLRQIIIWKRSGGINFSPSFYLPTHEWILVFAKPKFRLRDRSASGIKDIWEVYQETSNPHPAPFPIGLPSLAIETTNANTILDPFMGSGTTGLACRKYGKKFVGIDISDKYVVQAYNRIIQGDY